MENKLEVSYREWLENWLEEARAILTEAVFTSRITLIEGYWNFGKHIEGGVEEAEKKWSKKRAVFVKEAGYKFGKGERTFYYASQFYRKYPEKTKCSTQRPL